MTRAESWGRTGRVDLFRFECGWDVRVDGRYVGQVLTPDEPHLPGFYADAVIESSRRDDLPTIDAAVMWVLRRAVGRDDAHTKEIRDVWRAERRHVTRVQLSIDTWVFTAPGSSSIDLSRATWSLREVISAAEGAHALAGVAS